MPDTTNSVDKMWSSYAETVCYFQGEVEVTVDLRVAVMPPTRQGLMAMGLGESFGVVTAFNPLGVELAEAENARRASELEAELVSLGLKFVRVDCCSRDRSHCECSVAVVAPRAQVLELARRWKQLAIFWWDGAVFWIYGAAEDGVLKLPIQTRIANSK